MPKTTDEIIGEIAEVLAEWDGPAIQRIANEVLSRKVAYVGDSMFEQDPETCETCGEEMHKDCSGSPRCETCNGPCPQCDDGGGPI